MVYNPPLGEIDAIQVSIACRPGRRRDRLDRVDLAACAAAAAGRRRDVAEAARRRGEVAIGYRRMRKDQPDGRGLAGVVVNPVKSEALTYEPVDRIIVLARE